LTENKAARVDDVEQVPIGVSEGHEVAAFLRCLFQRASEPLTTVEWGKYAISRDPDGNEFELS
jgi:hypothetical protein